jgi:outer membrane protein assembly factor BamB
MNLFYVLIILLIFTNCSFDNKTGIWKSDSDSKIKQDEFSEFKDLSVANNSFDKIIPINKNYEFKKFNIINSKNWTDEYFNASNSFGNFEYVGLNKVSFKSSKISRNELNKTFLLENNNIITSDKKGNLIVYSIEKKNIIIKFNFYKKQFKRKNKNLNLIVENNIIYVSDNFGYIYAYNYQKKNLLWAKNYKVPFRSNLKIFGNKLIGVDQKNNLFYFNKLNGDILTSIPTEEVTLTNNFYNNIALSKQDTFLINTYGTVYSINSDTMQLNWFLNLNDSSSNNAGNIFDGSEISYDNKKLFITSNNFTYVINANNGSIIYKVNFSSFIKPLIIGEYLFTISKDNLLISFNLNNGKIIYSSDLNQLIANYLQTKKKQVKLKSLMVINNKLFVFLKNSYSLQVSFNGEIEKINKLPIKKISYPIFSKSLMIYLSNKNKIIIID